MRELTSAPQLGWVPLWYEGIPLQNSYPPLLPTLVAAFAWMVHISPALTHHQVSAALYCLGPVTVFFSQAVWQEIGDWAWPPASLIACYAHPLSSRVALHICWIALGFGALSFDGQIRNWLGGFGLAMAVVSYVMAQIASRSPLKKLVSFTLAMSALAYLVAAPWIPPSTITGVMHNAQFVVGDII